MNSQVIYFSLIWPKQRFSAACTRTMGILKLFLSQNGYINYCSNAKLSKESKDYLKEYQNVQIVPVDANNLSETQRRLKSMRQAPTIAIFDTFVAQQLYSHYVHRLFPNCIKILDLQDFHSLRRLRQQTVEKQWSQISQDQQVDSLSQILPLSLRAFPNPSTEEMCGRELASIYRSDLVLSCSEYQMLKLKSMFRLENLDMCTFLESVSPMQPLSKIQYIPFQLRKHFVWIGNFSHAPNEDSLQILINRIWPQIHQQLPHAQLHIFGSNFQQQYSKLQSLNMNIKSKGVLENIDDLNQYRVLLAPLRFGAGIQGKIVDSWKNYLPVVTTPIGAQGMFLETPLEGKYPQFKEDFNLSPYKRMTQIETPEDLAKIDETKQYYSYPENLAALSSSFTFGGSFNNSTQDSFAEQSVQLFTDEKFWTESVEKGFEIVKSQMSFQRNEWNLVPKIEQTSDTIGQMRKQNFLYSMTWNESLRANEQMARYINEKKKSEAFNKQTNQNNDGDPL